MTPSKTPSSSRISAAHASLVVALAAAAAIVWPWFGSPGYLFFTDFVWGPNPSPRWESNGSLLPLLMQAAGHVLPPAVVEKVVIASILLLLVLAGMRLARMLTDDARVVIATGLFFLFNPFVYDRLGYGQLYVLLGLGFLCLGAAELLGHLFRDKGHVAIIRAGCWFGLAIQFSPHAAFFIAVFGLAWLAAVVVHAGRGVTRLLLPIAAAATVCIVLNLNWLAAPSGALSHVAAITPLHLEAFQTAGKDGAEALKNVVMLSGFWGKDQYRYPDLTRFVENWGRSFLVLLPIMLLGAVEGLRDKRRRALAIGLLVAALVAVVLAVGIRLPGARGITLWLFEHLPFYAGLRETQKWVSLVVLCYGIFLVWGADRLLRMKFAAMNGALAATLLAAVIVLQAPLMLGGMSGAVRPTEYPADWQEADAVTAPQGKCDGRILFLPWHLYMRYEWIGTIVAGPASRYFRCPVLSGTNMEWGGISDESGDPEGAAVAAWLAGDGTPDLSTSGLTDISYVILAKEVDWHAYAWLDTAPGLRLLQDTATLKVYAVTKDAE